MVRKESFSVVGKIDIQLFLAEEHISKLREFPLKNIEQIFNYVQQTNMSLMDLFYHYQWISGVVDFGDRGGNTDLGKMSSERQV